MADQEFFMKKVLLVTSILAATTLVGLAATAYRYGMVLNPSPSSPREETSLYDFKLKNIDGAEVQLDAFKG
jgi:cytochrome oxidase Cu insertion factor (SCO1/SenC/PrrC family)